MAEMLLINPRRRARRAAPKARRVVRRRRNPLPAVVAPMARRRARSHSMSISGRHHRRRKNPISHLRKHMRRRRRNPISMGGLNADNLMRMLKDGAIGGAGAVAMDLIMGQLNTYLPITFQTVPGLPGVGDAFKAGLTALLGQGLSKHTKGLSVKMAEGALAVQAHGIIAGLLPATMPLGVHRLGFMSPATALVNATNRIGPVRQGVNRYTQPGARTPLLSMYTPSGAASPLLNRGPSARQREGYTR